MGVDRHHRPMHKANNELLPLSKLHKSKLHTWGLRSPIPATPIMPGKPGMKPGRIIEAKQPFQRQVCHQVQSSLLAYTEQQAWPGPCTAGFHGTVTWHS